VFRPRLAALDGLRLVAALAVAGFHYTTAWRLDGHNLPQYFLPHAVHFFVYGFLGVELFFLISGFVICMSSWGRTLGDFFTSRVSRLYPAYWVAVLISSAVAICWPVKGAALGDRPGGVQVLVNLTMLQQPLGVSGVDGVYWTLFTELRFYLLMALLLRKGLTYRKTVVFCCVWMTLSVLGPSLFNVQINTLLITDYSPYFIAGIAMYLMRRFGATPLLFGIAGLAWLVSLSRVEDRVHLMNSGFPVPVWPALVVVSLAYAVMLVVALGGADRITWRWLPIAGALTYPFYLLHQRLGYTIIRALYLHTAVPVWLLITGTGSLLLGLAWLVHRLLERPGTAWLKQAMRRGLAAMDRAEPLPSPPPPHVVPAPRVITPRRPARQSTRP
jgi:peptidoglycan/LPS O-acetylase OafA/YrhL